MYVMSMKKVAYRARTRVLMGDGGHFCTVEFCLYRKENLACRQTDRHRETETHSFHA